MSQQKHERDADYWKRTVNEVIDTLELDSMRKVGPVLRFNCTEDDLPFAFRIGDQLHYRGRILVPTAAPKQKKLREIQLDIEAQR